MRRLQAFEFNERPECPRFIQESIVDTLGTGIRWGRIYDAAGPLFARFCERAGCDQVLDLCSGSGEPVSILLEALARQGVPAPRFVLSDLIPNVASMESVAARHDGRIEVIREPVDATNVPAPFDRPARTVFSAFHHFPPEVAARILADSVAKRRAIFILEGFPRDFARVFSILPSMIPALYTNPFRTKRGRLLKLLFTLPIPLIPAVGTWDAIVSVLRIHTEEELRAMVAPLGGDYEWEYHELPFFPMGRVVAFFGVPAKKPAGKKARRSPLSSGVAQGTATSCSSRPGRGRR